MKKELIFDVKINDGGADASVEAVSGEVKTLGKDAAKTAKETQKLSDALTQSKDAMYELARAGKENTEEFRELQQEAARLEGVMKSVDAAISATASSGQGLQAALEVGSAVTAGYGAVQGAMALVGVESEELLQMMVKLQAAQSVLNGLEQAKLVLDGRSLAMMKARNVATALYSKTQAAAAVVTNGATIATRALSIAMMAIPIIAIVAGIIALIMWLSKLTAANNTVVESNEKMTKSYENVIDVIERQDRVNQRNHDNKIALAKSEGASIEELHELEMAALESREVARKRQIEVEKTVIKGRRALYQQALKEENYEEAKNIREQIEASRAKYKTLKELDGQYMVDKQIAENNHQSELKKIEEQGQKERLDKWKQSESKRKDEEEKARQLRIDKEKLMQDLINENIEDADLRARAILQTKHERERQDLIEKFGEDTSLLKELTLKQENELNEYEESLKLIRTEKEQQERDERIARENIDAKSRLEARLINEREDLEALAELRREMAQLEFDQEMQNEELTNGERLLLKAEFDQKIIDLEAEKEQRIMELRQANTDAAIGIAENYAKSVNSLNSMIFELSNNLGKQDERSKEERAKKQFAIQKALNLVMAGIDGARAITTSLASAPLAIGPAPNPAGIASLVAVGVNTAATLAAIASKQYTGGSSSGGSLPDVSLPSIPSPTYQNEGQSTEGLQGSGTTPPKQQSIKVNIVDSEIKAKLNDSEKVNVLSSL